jgi:hypothetical protein
MTASGAKRSFDQMTMSTEWLQNLTWREGLPRRIVFKNLKISRLRKSRKCKAPTIFTAARLS